MIPALLVAALLSADPASEATPAKMEAALTDDEVKTLSDYLGRVWTVDLPERRTRPARPPPGSIPRR